MEPHPTSPKPASAKNTGAGLGALLRSLDTRRPDSRFCFKVFYSEIAMRYACASFTG